MRQVAIAAVLVMSGCTTWTTIHEYDDHIPGGLVAVRPDRLLGTMQVDTGPRAELALALNMDRMCRYMRLPRVEHVVVRRHHLTDLGWLSMYVGLGLQVSGALVGAATVVGTSLAIAGAMFQLVPALALTGPRTVKTVDDEPLPNEAITSCLAADVSLGELTLTTPWGAVYTRPFDIAGTAAFRIDWLAAPATDAALLGRYTLRLTGGERDFGWTPTTDDAARIREAVATAHERPQDPWLQLEIE
jgi:hypothetical protein